MNDGGGVEEGVFRMSKKAQVTSWKKVMQWSAMILLSLLIMGCGHRATHGIHHAKKSMKAPATVTSEESTLVNSANAGKAKPFGSEGYFPDRDGNFSDLLQEEPLIYEESPLAKGNAGTSNDYWLNRTRAEQLTAQSGLRDVQFEFNSYQLSEQAKEVLTANAEWIKAHPNANVTIEGHCDDRGTQAYNYVLGEKRAIRTKAYLASLGVDANQLQTMTFGKDNPACRESSESCYQQNRRAHLVLGVNLASTAMQVR